MVMYGAAAGVVSFVLLSVFCGIKPAFNISVIAASAASVVFIIGVWMPFSEASELSGLKDDFIVEVENYPEYGDYYTIVQGEEEVSGLKCKAIVYFNDLRVVPGDKLSFYGRAAVDRNQYFISSMADGYFLTLRASKNIKVDRAEELPLIYYPLAFSKWLREDVILRHFGTGDEGGLLAALITGSTENISYEFRNALSLSGTSHIISVSGMHIGIIAGFALYLLGKKWGIYVSMPFIVFFGMSTGLNPPIVRAIIMLGMAFLAFVID
ncbi:MAG: ComEC/Rec2 family competence protein, partial [Clostridia bacterium]|nr:ComEC/Rec2 family competence protein [Clostridia bacterium]